MTTPDGEALLRAILDDPGDDVVRLVYADWLEERGQQQRGEFIRAQVELAGVVAAIDGNAMPARLPGEAWGAWEGRHHERKAAAVARRDALRRLEGRTLSVGGLVFHWLGDCIPLPGMPAAWHKGGGECVLYHNHPEDSRWAVTFRRGFVESVRCALDGWREHGPAIVRAHPVTRVKCPDAFASRDVPGGRWGVTLRVPIPPVLDEALSQVGWHDSQAACDDALSAALLWWARATRPRRR